ncbi:MAG: hypothetical protein K2J36_10545 [Ruminococcus sp.]|nr:hypothetical protein [Ruminococcus sp.]MDE6671907.1 hypothetical protein [Ruminococcus sp.]MDE6798429.1 hypothetical protein [Ruminococcus sp.]
MEDLKNAVMAVCIISAGVCMIENMVSGTRLKSQMKFLLNLTVVTVLVASFTKGGIAFEMPDFSTYSQQNYKTSQEVYNNEICRQTAENISSVIFEQLTASGINCTEIQTEVNISDDNSIFISKVIISSDDFGSAVEIVRNIIGNSTEVVNGSG